MNIYYSLLGLPKQVFNNPLLDQNSRPIQINSIKLTIDISDPNWQKELYRYFADQQLITTVNKM